MLDRSEFVACAERETGQAVLASCEARRQSDDSLIGKAGLLCVTSDQLAFVEDAILEPGQVVLTPRLEIRSAGVERGPIDSTIWIETADGRVTFESVAHDEAAPVVQALEPDADGAPDSGDADELSEEEPAPQVTVEPVSIESAADESLDLGVDAAEATAEPADRGAIVVRSDELERQRSPRRRRRRRARGSSKRPKRHESRPSTNASSARDESGGERRQRKTSTPSIGPYRPVAYLTAAVLAGCGALVHWSVAVLLVFVGYVIGLYVAEYLQRQRSA
ncbi:MAG: hypothetical protein JRI23_20630 [Deltaproteobacteria bacterium]|jgi:hypothetical protein|nr:hypothetical protein [Deltaproteobacteria bacterium]MBW2534297.1 hypothetical protein [Deltaproteobacteria bacterium]